MSFKIINTDYSGFSAADATAIISYDLGYMFYLQEDEWSFRIGNTGTQNADYHISVSGVNSTLMSGMKFSTDKYTYDYHAFLENIPAGGVSDTVWAKYTVGDDVYTTSGTFLIKVGESNHD